MNHRFTIISDAVAERACTVIRSLPRDKRYEVTIREAKRSLDANAALWAMLTDISSQVEWYGQTLTKEEWKDVMTAGLKRQKVVPGIDGGFVVLGAHTSKMTKSEMSDLLELISAFGAERGVRWSAREDAA